MRLLTQQTRNLLYRDLYDIFLASALPKHTPIRTKAATPLCRQIHQTRRITTAARRQVGLATGSTSVPQLKHVSPNVPEKSSHARILPLSCPGCGAPTQAVYEGEAGYFSLARTSVKGALVPGRNTEDDVVNNALESLPEDLRKQLGVDALKASNQPENEDLAVPICDRCHNLIHHQKGESISHPSIQSIQETIMESPHKHNHIYHIMDAADFPMSMISKIHRQLFFTHLRSKNRRAKNLHWESGRTWEMSFIITRADLLAPQKEQADNMMPVITAILLEALGEDVRMGNVHLVSAKRGWWTRTVKEKIAKRGGGGWFVGKVNVGKSSLFEVVFPKGSDNLHNLYPKDDAKLTLGQKDALSSIGGKDAFGLIGGSPDLGSQVALGLNSGSPYEEKEETEETFTDPFTNTSSLLPPAQPETKFPVMPIISNLPGTTASPIRVPFGNGKGELVDLPGLERKSIQTCVIPENRLDVIMKKRVVPERIVIKPRSSLLLGGGLIRITPKTPDLIIMAHAFVPIAIHLTSTEKAEAIQNGQRESGIASIMDPVSKTNVASAGIFTLNCDVTKKYAGPLTRKDAVGLKADRLPFIVYATDILIEGCGWVELVAQVRRPKGDALDVLERPQGMQSEFPEVEIFSPQGAFVGQRRTLSAWLVGGPKKADAKGRPRGSMKGEKARRERVLNE